MPHATNRVVNADIPYITHKNGERFITNIKDGTRIVFKYFDFPGNAQLKLSARGSGCFQVFAGDALQGRIKVGEKMPAAIIAEGVCPLTLLYSGEGTADLLEIEFESCTGADAVPEC